MGPLCGAVLMGGAMTFLIEPSGLLSGYLWWAGLSGGLYLVFAWMQQQSVKAQQIQK